MYIHVTRKQQHNIITVHYWTHAILHSGNIIAIIVNNDPINRVDQILEKIIT